MFRSVQSFFNDSIEIFCESSMKDIDIYNKIYGESRPPIPMIDKPITDTSVSFFKTTTKKINAALQKENKTFHDKTFDFGL